MKSYIFLLVTMLFIPLFAGGVNGQTQIEFFPGLQAVYIRPELLTHDAATTYMANIRAWGADEVFLEGGYGNRVLNHSRIFPVMDPDTDWMKELVEAARKQGLKVHVWVKICFWVHKSEALDEFPLLMKHPEWIDLNRKGGMVSDEGTYEEKFFIFVNPAHPGVMEAELNYIKELYEYDIDGISID